ncbi:nitronate monooxygenase [Nocardioides pocheonensis]|uniref:Nitronate monooxygenase n=1 Tax=Nocardioides pocheonensis TaxID=661485 RepID=A0A3N0GHS4_9ACTN|nr:nitronate monooxygenase [Nocardioides pocheonensis]RNM12033.1 nitronate monooxygenase [Nocardioides pocheonensis]
MRTPIAQTLDIELPIFAFSHCRDVVAAVTNAGGLGVLGAAWMTPDELDMSIEWIEKEVDGKPFGVDLVFPGTAMEEEKSPQEYLDSIPADYMSFVTRLLDEGGLSDLSPQDRDAYMVENARKMAMTNKKSQDQLDVTLARSSVGLVVGALGVTPGWVVEKAHAQGVQVGALVGTAKHAARQREAGVDLIVAQGTEAGGSVGSVASMVLWPQVVEAAAGVPVLAAGGISRGSHLLAALSLGCQGVWIGSLWLGTVESELSDEMRDRLFAAESEDATVARVMTGKQGRMLNTKYVEAWQSQGAPEPLDWPMQSILNGYSYKRAERARNLDYWTYAVGQVVGDMKGQTTVRREIERMLIEYSDALESLSNVTELE